MDFNQTRALIAKYWECETSLQEEAQLREFFSTYKGELPGDLQEAAPMFQYFQQESQAETAAIAALIADGPWESPIETKPATKVVSMRKPFYTGWMRYAAVVMMTVGLGYSVQQFNDKYQEEVKLNAEVHEAFEETQRALLLLSKNLNKGTKPMENLSKINAATDAVKPSNF
ncbi:hypothetical protein LX64_01914 [Chitinophaga skermanii]|uniref:Uncharacterized protein n=1 Tax=Chitinophaga skermanii TaxID=331697 RepID=A0A327QYP5_9BACT|nr:hypothetical protein [Chitinophaga skermanii]RAJ06787.1 hypothetical protein LX64_01914 [Chitinophaga skermanii]